MTKLNPAVTAGIAEALRSAGHDPAVPLASSVSATVAADLVARLAEDPLVVNATNSEPWYQSRVTWGAIVAAAAPLIGLLLYLFGAVERPAIDGETQSMIVAVLVSGGSVVGGLITLWGRWGKRKAPIGARGG